MEILLREDIDRLGKRGEVVNVAAGYARNYLIPRGLAAKATEENKRLIEAQHQSEIRKEQARVQARVKMGSKMQSTSVTIVAAASPEGHLFGSVGADKIAEAFRAEGLPVEDKMIQLDTPFREVGVFTITVKTTPDTKVTTRVWIVAEWEQ